MGDFDIRCTSRATVVSSGGRRTGFRALKLGPSHFLTSICATLLTRGPYHIMFQYTNPVGRTSCRRRPNLQGRSQNGSRSPRSSPAASVISDARRDERSSQERGEFESFSPCLFSATLQSFSTLPEDAVLELIESARPILDNVWQLGGVQTPNPETPVYTQQRMTHLLTLLSESICSLVVEHIQPLDTWQGAIGEVERVLTWAIKLIATWERDTLELTKLAWPMRSANAWAGDAFVSRGLAAIRARLDEILKIREVRAGCLERVGDSRRWHEFVLCGRV
jgi:hypothetical protein